MKDALKRAAQAMGLVPAPVADAVATVANAVAEAAGWEATSAAPAEAEAQADVAKTLADGTELVTHTFEAPATAASYHAVVTEAAVMKDQLEMLGAELTEAKAALASVTAALDTMKAEAAKAAADALTAKMAARKDLILKTLGTDRADAVMAATEGLADAQFSAVMVAMGAKFEAEAATPEFQEVGVDAQADVEALTAEAESNGTLAILKAKYQQTAAN